LRREISGSDDGRTAQGPDESEGTAVLLTLFLIGLGVALDPLPLTAFLVILPSKRGARKGAAFVFGWLVSLGFVVIITVLATGNNPPKPKTAPSLAALAVKAALGAVLIVIAVRRIRARRRPGPKPPKKTPKWQEHVDNMSPWFALGLAPALQPWVLIGAGAATVVQAKLSSWQDFLALFLYCLLASSSYLAMEIYAVFRPEQSHVLLTRIRAWIDAHTDQAIIVGSMLLGLWLMANSIYLILS
jgi:threonine/homoserine/homoserine lactone efflux protein